MSDVEPRASVVITGRNRKEDLRAAIESCLRQTVSIEVLVLDDASDDGTVESLRAWFSPECAPQVRIIPHSERVGYIVLRNRGAALARAKIIFSIDDDAVFTTPRIVEDTLAAFDNPRVGAVAIPFQNIRVSDQLFQHSPDVGHVFVTSDYIGTAHAVRKDLFLRLGGYRESLVHQGEESDFCIRLLEAGYVVRLGISDPIHHFVSPKRDMWRLHYYGSRNNILFVWHNVPGVGHVIAMGRTTVGTLLHGLRVKAFGIKLRAVLDAYGYALGHRRERRPVSAATVRLFRTLRRSPLKLDQMEGVLPPLSEGDSGEVGSFGGGKQRPGGDC